MAPLAVQASEAQKQLQFSTDKPRILSIQPRPYRLGHEFLIGAGLLPLDAFYVGAVLSGSYTYHFSDFWAWELVSLHYSHNIDTSLEGELLRRFQLRPEKGAGQRIKLFATTSVVIKPMFGKLAVLNDSMVYSETFALLGAGPLLLGDAWRFAISVGCGLRFWASQMMSFRFGVRDYVIFSPGFTVENTLFFMLSASFNHNADHVQPQTTGDGA